MFVVKAKTIKIISTKNMDSKNLIITVFLKN